MGGAKQLLLVDDDPDLREHISAYLRANGFEVHLAEHGRAMETVLAREHIDLIVLDLTMPGESGLSICRRLADNGGPPIIMASAAGEEIDRVLGLELGADDYLPKPFSPRELLARVRAVLRRQEEVKAAPATRGKGYAFAGFHFDPSRHQLRAASGTVVLLTAGESALLGAFLANPQRILSRDQLAEASGAESSDESRAVDLHISRLRRKLHGHGDTELIRTQRGLGYMLDCKVSRA